MAEETEQAAADGQELSSYRSLVQLTNLCPSFPLTGL
jgi:hypothetical protein